MLTKTVTILAFFVVITAAKYLDLEQDVLQDPSQCNLGKTECSNDSECQSWCGDRTVICNFRWKCNYENLIDTAMRKKPCYSIGLWKARCESNNDCLCNQGNGLICEENECVENRPSTTKLTVRRHRL